MSSHAWNYRTHRCTRCNTHRVSNDAKKECVNAVEETYQGLIGYGVNDRDYYSVDEHVENIDTPYDCDMRSDDVGMALAVGMAPGNRRFNYLKHKPFGV